MKKILSISLLSLFLIHQFGYIGLYFLGQRSVQQHWLSKSEYVGSIKEVIIPIDLPYWTSQDEYVAIDGTFEHEGKIYRKIRQKYSEGNLHVQLVQDFESQRLNQSIKDWLVSLSDDNNNQQTSSHQLLVKAFAKDYLPDAIRWSMHSYETPFVEPFTLYSFSIKESDLQVETPPPLFV